MKSGKLNICIVTRITTDHSFGGMQDYVNLLAKGFAKRGNKVFIITTALPNKNTDEIRTQYSGLIETHFIKNTRCGSYRKNFFTKAYRKYIEINQRDKIDIIHGQSAAALKFIGKTDIPVITSLFGVGYCETPYQQLIFPRLSFMDKLKFIYKWPKITVSMRYMYQAAAGADRIILISRFSKRELKRVLPGFPHHKISVIHCGVENIGFDIKDKRKLKQKLGIKKTLVLSAGRIEPQKGIHILLQAWRQKNEANAELVILGDGSYLPHLKKYAEKYNIKNCSFKGKLPQDEFFEYFGAADLFVYPELTKPAFGLVAAQALAHATPVIGADHGAIPEVIGAAGLLFIPGNSNDLSDKLDYFLQHRENWNFMRKKAQQRVASFFSVDEMVKQTLTVFYSELKKKRKK
ncbi:glycosyltransferase family 4 protein [bacterium]|nr:glycosyltransferase family 4 protein [bacterium]